MKLTIQEIADCMDLPVDTLDRWIRQGRIPIYKQAGRYAFETDRLKKWARSNNLPFHLKRKTKKKKKDHKGTLLSAMQRGGVFHGILGEDAFSIFSAAVACIDGLSAAQQQQLHQLLMEREEMASTGIGRGVAIPHPRAPFTEAFNEPAIITCFLNHPVDMGSVDDQPVFVLFLLLSTSVENHLHLLSRLSFCVREPSFIDLLQSCPQAGKLFKEIERSEQKLHGGATDRRSAF
jgi:PTS system nitrogen regulatory IIA component